MKTSLFKYLIASIIIVGSLIIAAGEVNACGNVTLTAKPPCILAEKNVTSRIVARVIGPDGKPATGTITFSVIESPSSSDKFSNKGTVKISNGIANITFYHYRSDPGKIQISAIATIAIKAQDGSVITFNPTGSLEFYAVKIETETEATIPLNRTRKKLGVGERVLLTFQPVETSPITWSKAGRGALGTPSGNSVIFTADDRASAPSVKATYLDTPFTVNFKVVEPKNETAVKTNELIIPAGVQGVGMKLEVTVNPTDVSFTNVEILEVPGPATKITGYFKKHIPEPHSPSKDWLPLHPGNTSTDSAGFFGFPQPWSPGSFEYVIPIQWRVIGSSNIRKLPNEIQKSSITSRDGTSTVSKLGQSASRTP